MESGQSRRVERLAMCVAVLGCAVLAHAPKAGAQGRGVRQVGGVSAVGQYSSSVSTFSSYSTGVENIGPVGAPTSGLSAPSAYRSSVGSGARGWTAPAGFSPGAAAPRAPSATASTVLVRPSDLAPISAYGAGAAGLTRPRITNLQFVDPKNMMPVLGPGELTSAEPGEPITTFAPTEAGDYAQLLRSGELSVRNGRYQAAAESFRQAIHLAPEAPESLLSLMHAEMSLGHYTLAAHYLRKTLLAYPALPTAQIRLRGFFRNAAEFLEVRQELRNYLDLELHPHRRDFEAQLVLAYCEWFDDNVPGALRALRAVANGSDDPFLVEAAEVFWEGCVATQRVSGSILEAPATAQAAPAE